MKLTGLDVFDATVERTTTWIHELTRELNWKDYRKSYFALRSVLHGIRDHLAMDAAVKFGNQFPMLIRGFYYENWDVEGKPRSWTSQKDLLSGICVYLDGGKHSAEEAEVVARAVFRLLEKKASEGEIENLQDLLPAEFRELWSPVLRAA